MTTCRHGLTASWCADCQEKAKRRGASKLKAVNKKPAGAAKANSGTTASGRQAKKATPVGRQPQAKVGTPSRRGEDPVIAATRRLLMPGERAAEPRMPSAAPRPRETALAGHRTAEQVTEAGSGTAAPPLDPDLVAREVWVLPSGAAFHRADCHVLVGKQPRKLASRKARRHGLKRCEHCSPLA